MVKNIIKSPFIFRRAEPADKSDLQTAVDLADTLTANADICVGMAANMIGINKNIIAVSVFGTVLVMINPKIIGKSKECYEAEEGCLSLSGVRKTTRYSSVKVEYLDMQFKKHTQEYSGFTAQIIQHEIDHCSGIVI